MKHVIFSKGLFKVVGSSHAAPFLSPFGRWVAAVELITRFCDMHNIQSNFQIYFGSLEHSILWE